MRPAVADNPLGLGEHILGANAVLRALPDMRSIEVLPVLRSSTDPINRLMPAAAKTASFSQRARLWSRRLLTMPDQQIRARICVL